MGSKSSFNLGDHLKGSIAPTSFRDLTPGLEIRSGKSQKARQAAQAQERQIASQRQKEELRRSESEDEIARKRVTAKGKTAGRSLLTATSPTGTQGLGG